MQNKEVTSKQVVTAILLGDGNLQWCKKTSHYGMNFVGSVKEQDYMEWKVALIKKYLDIPVKIHEMANGDKNPVIRAWYWDKRFIEPYKKFLYTEKLDGRIQKNLDKFLLRMNHPLCLAIWFMDDGSCQGHKYTRRDGKKTLSGYTLYLGTNQFPMDKQEQMSVWFQKEFGVMPKIYRQVYSNPKHPACGKTQYRLGFSKKDSETLYHLMEPYIIQIPSMIKKFRFAYYLTSLQGDRLNPDFELIDS